MNVNEAIKRIVKLEDLNEKEAREIANKLMNGEAKSSQIGSLLTALTIKGESNDEILGFSKGLRDNMIPVSFIAENMVDTCGTGGDGFGTFNVSTTVAFVVAAAGIKVAKHGNKALSSKCGSADVLNELGININMSEKEASLALEKIGIAFLFAPNYHKAMKSVSEERHDIGIRTIFNLVGPIVNPANLTGQLLGVSNGKIQRKLCEVLKELNLKKALVVHGLEGLDEISTCGETEIYELNNSDIFHYRIKPEDYKIQRADIKDLKGGNKVENARIIISILEGELGPKRDMVILNAGAALYVGGKALSINEGIELAKELIDSGLAIKKFKELREFKGEVF